MRRIIAIAKLAIASAVRSRVVVTLLALLLLAIIALPLTIESDGTLAGHIRILLSYTLGVSYIILAVATLWSGCSAIALEIQDKQAHLLVTKPVHRIQIWLGKWLGLVILNALLLAFSALVIYGMLRWTTRGAAVDANSLATLRERVLVARDPVQPLLGITDEVVGERYANAVRDGVVPPEISPAEAKQTIRSALIRQAYTVEQGARRTWRFELPPAPSGTSPLVRFRFSTSTPGPQPVNGVWYVGSPDEPAHSPIRDTWSAGQYHTVSLPAGAGGESGILLLTFQNVNETPITVLFRQDNGLVVQAYAGSFEANYLRALLNLLARLAFLAALGVGAGALFSTPIAVFVALTFAVLLQFAGYVESMSHETTYFATHAHTHHGQVYEPGFWDQAFHALFGLLNVLLKPLQDPGVFDLLGTGLLIPWSTVLYAAFFKLAVYGGLIALGTSWLLRRREIGLPS